MLYKKYIRLFKISASAIPLLLICNQISAKTYYTRSSGVNWNVNNSWSTVGYGQGAASAFPVAGDTVNIGDGITVYINTNSACGQLNIGQGTSGIVQYFSTGNYTLTVSGDITINNGGKLWYNSNASRTHTLDLGGNLINNGTVKFIYDANDLVNITFSGATNTVVSGSGAWTLYNVTMNKSSIAATVEVQSTTFESAILTLATTEGTYIHNNSSSYSINSSAAADYTINNNTIFKVPQGTLTFSPNSDNLFIQGQLYVNGGTVNVGKLNSANGIRYDSSPGVLPYIEVSSGTLNVYAGFNNKAGTDYCSFNMTGGTILLNYGTHNLGNVFVINDLANSIFSMSGGTIIIQTHCNAGGGDDFAVCGTNGTVTSTGGTVQFGNSSTANNTTFCFAPYASVIQPNFEVTGPTANTNTLSPDKGATSDFQLLSLYIDTNKTFDIRSIAGANGDSKKMTLTSTYGGINALYNRGTFTPRTGTLNMNSSSPQSLGGTSSLAFYNLTMSGSGNMVLAFPVSVSNSLTMTSGNIQTTSTNILTLTGTASASIGSSSSYIDGPMIQTVATASLTAKTFPIGKAGSYRPVVLTVTHSNATSVTYQAEVFNSGASALPYTLPAALSKVSAVRYVQFTRQNVANFTNGKIQMYYDTDDGVTDYTNLAVAHDDGVSLWQNFAGTATGNTTGSITSGTFTTAFHSYFTLANKTGGSNPLPVELIGFTASRSANKVICNWSTASEINNNYFTVERSADGIHYDSLLRVAGAGNSTELLNYSAVDNHPLAGDARYRLMQTDYDGKTSISQVVFVPFNEAVALYTVYPNPSLGNSIFINKNGTDMSDVKVTVQDMTGREVEFNAQLAFNNKEILLSIAPGSCKDNSNFIVSLLSAVDLQRERVLIKR